MVKEALNNAFVIDNYKAMFWLFKFIPHNANWSQEMIRMDSLTKIVSQGETHKEAFELDLYSTFESRFKELVQNFSLE